MVVVATFVVLLLIGLPVAIVIGLAAVVWLFTAGMDVFLVAQRMFTGLDTFSLLCVPFFVMVGELMNGSGLTDRLIKVAQLIVGHLPGGLAHINVVTSMLFAGVSGSASADTAAVGGVLIPAMIKEGYSPGYSAAVTAASSCIGPIIPPSMLMIFYAITAEESIQTLFCAGMIPGILMGITQMILCAYYAKKEGHKPNNRRATFKEVIAAIKECWLALLAPIVLVGTILGGVCTPTESGAICCLYCFIVGMFVYKNIKLKDMPQMLANAALMTGTCFYIVATASFLAWMLTAQGVSQAIGVALSGLTGNWVLLMTMFILILLFFGTFMESIAAIIILTPIFLPLATAAGISKVHLGLVMVLGMDLAMITPPVGICLFIAMRIAKISLEDLVKSIWPFMLVCFVVLFAIGYFPQLVTFLPKLLGMMG